MKSSLLSFPELRPDYTSAHSKKPVAQNLLDSFSEFSLENTSSKVVSVCSAKKNTAGDATATVSGSSATLVKHSSTVFEHSSRVLSVTSTLAPLGSAIGSDINLLKDAHIQKIVEGRFHALHSLWQQICEAHFPIGVPELESHFSIAALHTPSNHSLSACETMLHTLTFALVKIESRIRKLKIQQTGSSMIIAGSASAVAGSAFLGVGAIPGVAIAAAGSAVNLSPTIHAMGRAVYKNIQGTKGVDRKSSAYFIWALSLRKAVSDGLISKHQLRENNEAVGAYCLAEEWHYLREKEDVLNAQNMAFILLQRLGVMESKSLAGLDLCHPKYLEKIENRLKSTPNV